MCTLRLTCQGFVLALLLFVAPARADDLADFNAAIEAAMRHHRAALGYLRTENFDLVPVEVAEMREAWARVSTLPRPRVFKPERYTATILEIAAALVGIDLVMQMGNAKVVRESLEQMRVTLSNLRRESGVPVLADCVLDANNAMEPLSEQDKAPQWERLAAYVDLYRVTLQRCDGMTPARIKDSGEFRRLIDGALASLAQIPKAIEARDRDLLHRLIIELRAFDNLLAFRYG